MAYETLKVYDPDSPFVNPRFYKEPNGFMMDIDNRTENLGLDPLKAMQLAFIAGFEKKNRRIREVLDL